MTELLVSSALTLLVLAMVANMFIATTKVTSMSNQTRTSNDVGSNVMNEVSSVLRFATDLSATDPAIVEGSTTKVTVYSLSNTSAASPAPSKITFQLVTGTPYNSVTETRCLGTASGSTWVFTTACTVRTLGTGVLAATGASNQLFTYLNGVGTAITLSTLADRDSVASVLVNVRAQAENAKTDPILLTNTVVLRNLGLDSVS